MFKVAYSYLVDDLALEVDNIPVFEEKIKISENLVKPLKSLRDSGKVYTKISLDQIEKSFERNSKDGSSRVKKYKNLSLFDLLTPVLMPSVDMELFSNLEFPSSLFNYQVQGIKFLLSNQFALLADQMGTGKTVMATTALRILFIKGLIRKALIVVPSSLISVWQSHLENWAPEISFTVISEDKRYRDVLWSIRSHVYLISYDTLKYDYKDKFETLKSFAKDLDALVLDEAHNIKNSETLKAKAVKYLAKKVKYRWALSGTPLQNHLKEMVSLYGFLKPDENIKSDINEEKIKELIKPIMLRRLKRDVLTELPEKLPPEIESFELSYLQREYYEKFLHSEKKRLESIYKRFRFEKNFSFLLKQNIIYSIQKLRQICNFPPESISSPKADRLVELVKEIVESGEKVVIFSNFVKEGIDKIVKNLRNTFPSESIVTYEGSMNQQERNITVKRFMEDEKCKIFVGTLNSAGEGLTLTAGSYVIFFDLHWNPAKMWQAEDRVHRIGQKNKVNIYYFITKNTVEERILTKINQKKMMIESVIDSEIDEIESISIEDLLDFIDLKMSV